MRKINDDIHQWKWTINILIMVLWIVITACETNVQNDWVQKILYCNNQQLRMNFITRPIQEIKSIETLPLKFEDEAGLSYLLNLNPNITAEISYFKNIEDTSQRIISFSANIHFTQDQQAIETYKAIENSFQKIYGVFDGTFGNQEWIVPDSNYRVSLKLFNQKKEILITCSSIS
jgi:hypothetical protein